MNEPKITTLYERLNREDGDNQESNSIQTLVQRCDFRFVHDFPFPTRGRVCGTLFSASFAIRRIILSPTVSLLVPLKWTLTLYVALPIRLVKRKGFLACSGLTSTLVVLSLIIIFVLLSFLRGVPLVPQMALCLVLLGID